VAGLLVLSACDPMDFSDEPEQVDSIENDDGSRTIVYDEEGHEVQVTSSDDLTIELPDGFAPYPGARVNNSRVTVSDQGTKIEVTMQTGASTDQVISFYRQQAQAAGVEISTDEEVGVQRKLEGQAPDGLQFSAVVTDGYIDRSVRLTIDRNSI
jgi:hypothetical protein